MGINIFLRIMEKQAECSHCVLNKDVFCVFATNVELEYLLVTFKIVCLMVM
jgi:hypothetical protein